MDADGRAKEISARVDIAIKEDGKQEALKAELREQTDKAVEAANYAYSYASDTADLIVGSLGKPHACVPTCPPEPWRRRKRRHCGVQARAFQKNPQTAGADVQRGQPAFAEAATRRQAGERRNRHRESGC